MLSENRLELRASVALGTKPYRMVSKQPNNFLRNASDPFTIPLGRDDYYLTREALYKVIDNGLSKKRGRFMPQLKIVNFKKGKLRLSNSFDKEAYELVVDIEKDKLFVACSCGSQVATLCIHAFTALDRLAWYIGSDYFDQFRPGGLYEMSMLHQKHFRIKTNYDGSRIQPKETLRTVYALSDEINFNDAVRVLNLPSKKSGQTHGGADTLCYMIVNIKRKDHPPFVVPCMGRLNKAATAINGFYQFLTGIQKEYDHLLTEEQNLLNKECLLLYKEAEQLPGRFFSNEQEAVDINRYAAYFAGWKKIWPLLQNQPYVFVCTIYWKRDLKGKPAKSLTRQVSVSPYHPRLCFRLTDKPEFFQLEINLKLADKTISRNTPFMLFFIQDEKNNLCLLASPVDAYIAEWFRKAGNRITVFKEHFKDFETNFLSHLQTHYEVIRINAAAKRKTSKQVNKPQTTNHKPQTINLKCLTNPNGSNWFFY